MSADHLRRLWVSQCEAARNIKLRYGDQAAFDYIVAEKLLNHAAAAKTHSTLAAELPGFVAEIRRIFSPQEMAHHLWRLERELAERAAEGRAPEADDDTLAETAEGAAADRRRFAVLKALLVADRLGTA
jgi:hypothetical protein